MSLPVLGVALIIMRNELGEEEAEEVVEVEQMEMSGGGRVMVLWGGREGREGREGEGEEGGSDEGMALMQVIGESAIVMLVADMQGWSDGLRLTREILPPSLLLLHTHKQLSPPGSTDSPSIAHVS